MRETVIAILAATAAWAGYLYFKKITKTEDTIDIKASKVQQQVIPSNQHPRFSKSNLARLKGDLNNERKSHRERVSAKRKNEGSSSDVATSQGLPSIYQEDQPDGHLGQQLGQQQPGAVSAEVSEDMTLSQPALQSPKSI